MADSFQIIEEHLEKAREKYTSGVHYETLIEARKEYFEITGQVNEEDDDYESRMNAFNDWYLLQFVSRRGTRTVIKEYLTQNTIEDNVSKSLLTLNHSIFEFGDMNFSKKLILKDILHDNKIKLPITHPQLGLIKSDLFIGRVITYNEENYLLSGLCTLPKQVKSIIAKECKKIRKLKDPMREVEFLLKLESLKTKWRRYGHIDVTKIFIFA